MKTLLCKWKPKNWLGKLGKVLLHIVAVALLLIVVVIPFIKFEGALLQVFKWIWVGGFVLNLDSFADYKKAREEKTIHSLFSLLAFFTLIYLCNYWSLIPISVAIVCSAVIGLLEFAISVKVYKTIRFTPKQESKLLSKNITDGILLGSIYISAVSLFILGHLLSKAMIFIFGIIAMLMLFSAVMSVISKGFSASKSIVSTIGIILDIVSVLALIGYLIYLTPSGESNGSLQEIVLSLASAVIGGTLTLAGVAWTIRHGQEERKKDEIQKAKPLFTFNMMYAPLVTVEGKKVCFDEDENKKRRNNQVVFEIENSDRSSFVIERLFHDGQWWNLDANKVVLPNKTIYIEFHFTEDVNNLFVEVKDALGNCYYYEIKVLCLNLLTRPTPHHPFLHTVREIREISLQEIEVRIK